MRIENIVIIVCIWNNGVQIGPQQLKGGEFYRIVVERARDLLNQMMDEIVNMEQSQGVTNDLGTKLIKSKRPNFKRLKLNKEKDKGVQDWIGANAANMLRIDTTNKGIEQDGADISNID